MPFKNAADVTGQLMDAMAAVINGTMTPEAAVELAREAAKATDAAERALGTAMGTNHHADPAITGAAD